MPNMHMRRRDRGKYNYYEHDDRGFSASSSSERRVSFKNHGREGRRNHQASLDQKQKMRNALLLDSDDIDMNTTSLRNFSITRVVPYSVSLFRGRGGPRHPRDSPVPGFKRPPRILHESVSSWYRVTVLKGNNHEKEYLIRVLLGHIRPHTFVPYGYRVSGEDVSFFIDDHTVAVQLMNADRKITVEGGTKLKIIVKPNMAFVEIDDKLKEKVKLVMSRRYQAATFALDLRKFYADPEFISEGLFIPINRPNVLSKIVQIICESIPDLRALDLSENLLFNFDCLKPLADKLTQLKVLHMSNNRIKHLSQIESLKGLPLEDFNIDGNPVCDKYNDQSLYVREVRKRFPKVIKLDGIDLPPPIVFDVEDETSLMPVRGSFYCDVNGRTMVLQFLEEYYKIFDSDSRQPLINAYHENAQFSLTCTPGLTSYIPDSRNLLIVQSLDKRIRLLRQGKSTIVSFFGSLIKTQHDPASFAIDVLLFNPQLIYVSVAGVYREPTSNKKLPIRAFSRVFIIVPVGSGFCIINDMFSITNASPDQAKEAFKLPVASAPPATPVPVQPPPVMVSPVASAAVSPVPLALDPGVKTQQEMVAALAMQSGMNLAWSEKCLSETNWNYENALFVFSELNKQGKVPADAFLK